MKVLALDYGSARTGVAVSDPTGTIARPFGVVERAASESGLARIAELGGKVLMPPMDIEPGRFAVLNDPTGAVFSILKMASH